MSGYSPRASRNPCSTVPGFPNMYVIPSASSCSMIAKRPGLLTTGRPLRCRADRARMEPPLLQAVLEHLDHLLPGQVRVGRRAPCDERVVDDHRGLVAVVAVVGPAGSRRVAEDPLERVRRRAPDEV